MTISYLLVLLATSGVAFQAATPLERFKSTTDRYARMRVVSETVTGRTPASPEDVRVLLEAAIGDSEVSIRRQAVGSIASILN
jgi:hypothetical protein